MPGLGTCMTGGLGRVIIGAVGDPSLWSLPVSEDAFLSSRSMLESSGGFPPAVGANFEGSNSLGMNGAPPGVMGVGDSMMGPGKAGGLPMGADC